MDTSTANWNDFLDSEVSSDFPSTNFGLQGGEAGQQTYLPGFEQAQGSQSDHHNFAQHGSHFGVIFPLATQMQYGPVHHHPTTMHGTPAWFCQQSKDICNATATPSFPIAEEAWNSSSVPAVKPSHAAPHMDGTACLSVGDDGHVSFGKQTLSSSTLEAPTFSDEGTKGNTILSGSSRPCSCPVCLGLHTNWFSSKAPSSSLMPREQYSCRLPACDWMARGLDGATANRYTNALLQHEKTHFGQKGRFVCLEEQCRYVTKRWGDLTRHYSSKHCTNLVRRFVCPVLGCKYSRGGFARKDKLQSHVRNVHRGEAKPGVRAGQVIRPKGQGGL